MKNFFRIVRLTLARRWTFAGAILCSIGVALFWGGNLALIKPVIEIVFTDKTPHGLIDQKVENAKTKLQATTDELAKLRAEIAAAQPEAARKLQAAESKLWQREQIEARQLDFVNFLQPLAHRFLPNNTFLALGLFLGAFVMATLIKDAMLVGNLVLVERLTQLAMLDLRNKMFRKTLQMEMAHFGEGHSSHIMHRISADVNCAFAGVNVLCGRMILEPLKMITCLIGAAIICWKLLVISLLVAPLAAYVLMRLIKSMRKANRRAMEELGQLYTLLVETLTNIQTVKAFGMERHERRRYRQSG